MYKKLIITMISIIVLSACNNNSVVMKTIQPQTVVYGNYTLSFANQHTLKVDKTIKITKGWTDNINLDQDNKIWVPIVNKDGNVPPDNRVIVYNLNNGAKDEIKVGDSPHYIYFNNHNAYVVCDEDGTNPTLYKINSQLKATKVTTVHQGGLINSAAFDGKNIYLLTSHVGNEIYPMIVKLSLNGSSNINIITKENIGNHGLAVIDDKLIAGLQSGVNATLGVFDKNTLQRLKDLPYEQDMVGQIKPLANHEIAVTNYSDVKRQGNKITF
jgi:hypothetical protein